MGKLSKQALEEYKRVVKDTEKTDVLRQLFWLHYLMAVVNLRKYEAN